MSRLIALVATAVIVNGDRIVIQPGQDLPEQNEHDEAELLANGAAMDPESAAATDKAKRQEKQWADREFQEARERVMAERASTAPADTATDKDSAQVADGEKANATFPDVSELDRAHGRVNLSDLHQAVADAPVPTDANKPAEAAGKSGKKSTVTKE